MNNSANNVIPNNTYSIRIRYVGECNDPPLIISGIVIPQCLGDGDVYVDDILVTESISGSTLLMVQYLE